MKCSIILLTLALAACGTNPSKIDTVDFTGNEIQLSENVRIQKLQFENSLAPAVSEKGVPVSGWSLKDRMAHYNIPGVSIAVFANGKIIWSEGYGLKIAGGSESVNDLTLFQAASISKHATAIAGLALVDSDVITLDEPANSRLKSWQIPMNELTQDHAISMRDLLSHTAGLNVTGFSGYVFGEDIPTPIEILDGKLPANTPAVRVVSKPGVSFSYSGGGTTVAQVLIEDVAGKHFAEVLNELVLRPAGMDSSGFWQPLPENLKSNFATGHASPGLEPIANGSYAFPELGAAGLWSTPADLARLSIALTASANGGRDALLSEESFLEIINGQLGGKAALGVTVLSPEGETTVYGHTGGNRGYKSVLFAKADGSGGMAVMTNADTGFSLISELTAAYAKVYGISYGATRPQATLAITERVINDVSGLYRTEVDMIGEVFIKIEGDGQGLLISAPPIQARTKVLQVGADEFVLADGYRLSFKRDDSGVITSLISGMANGVTAKRMNNK